MGKKKRNKGTQKITVDESGFSLKDYFYINLFFWAFLAVIAIIVFITSGGKMDPVIKNVFAFIFLVFGGGFTFVSVFDFIYEKTAKKDGENE